MHKRSVLVQDPERVLAATASALEILGWRLHFAVSVDQAKMVAATERPAVGLFLVDSPGRIQAKGIEALVSARDATWIAVANQTTFGDPDVAQFVLQLFFDYHTLPLDTERLAVSLGRAYGWTSMSRKLDAQRLQAGSYGMTGHSRPMLALYRQIEKTTRADAPVLITGESGTGKELVARAIYQHCARANGPFVAMNCGALPPNLIQSELFGYDKGAFTGASQRKIGKIEAAGGGVLFLDEIGDLPLELQATLLRFLQEKTITRLGSTEKVAVNVRVIAATHVHLQKAIAAGHFRADLFYRLNVVTLHAPALRERLGDIPLLADMVLREFARDTNPAVKGFSSEAHRAMGDHDWPGNVRELINRVHQAIILTENSLISASDLGLKSCDRHPSVLTLDQARTTLEREVIEATMRRNQNNLSQAARELGVSRVTLYRMIDRLNIIL